MLKISINCPYCNRPVAVPREEGAGFSRCDCDDGGCDKYFAYNIRFKINVETSKLEFAENKDSEFRENVVGP